jgi:nitrite reductase/ring-hydroxylating ferredoxin subunit
MPLVKVGSMSQFAPDTVTEVMVGENAYAICNVEGNLSAMSGVCPHRGGPLGQGRLEGVWVICPWHAWEWDCRSGAMKDDTSRRAPTVPLEIRDGDVLLELP